MSRGGKEKEDLMEEEEQGEDTCPICSETIENTPADDPREPVGLLCDPDTPHVFHRECVDMWLQGPLAVNRLCPICRKDPRQEQIIQLARMNVANRIAAKRNLNVIQRIAVFVRDINTEAKRPDRTFLRAFVVILLTLFLLACVVGFFIIVASNVTLGLKDTHDKVDVKLQLLRDPLAGMEEREL